MPKRGRYNKLEQLAADSGQSVAQIVIPTVRRCRGVRAAARHLNVPYYQVQGWLADNAEVETFLDIRIKTDSK